MNKISSFQVDQSVFYVGSGVGTITAITEETISGHPGTYCVIVSKRKPGVLKVPIGNPKLIPIKTFVGDNPLKQVRTVLAGAPGPRSPLKGHWAPKFHSLERWYGTVATLHDVLTVVRDTSRATKDVHPISSIEFQRSLKWCIVDSLTAVLKQDEVSVLQTLNKILKANGKLAFPD